MLGYVDRHSQVSNESRTKMVRSAASLIRRRGLSRASFADIVADSGAPRGSIYHHFPQGKDQLAKEAIRATSDWVLARQGACAATTPVGVLECFIDLWRQVVVASNGAAGCVVAGVAGDIMPGATELMAGGRAPVKLWGDLLASHLRAGGVSAARAGGLAGAAFAGVGGAV